VFRMQLEANGIAVGGEPRRGEVPKSARLLHGHRGKSLADLVRLFMTYSNNAMGESLVKSLGARASGGPGNWTNGIPALRAELASAGLDVGSAHIVDGSGLSYENRVSPELLVAALRVAADSFAFGAEFEASLPKPGAVGTLEERGEGSLQRVRAKTGLLKGMTALSGYAARPDGSRAVFSLIVNDFKGDAESAMSAVDAFAAALVRPD
jgi:D-alanyl-D-alanine carboxypeptidase/D-alanyl-D-alanine-endopeptidase (penicillin-binding protein 4)